ncbi:MAG: hypothetical protein GC157_03695 [Frankiales bacterium]|nr:hypothetical protein [Frankiales bacterium]
MRRPVLPLAISACALLLAGCATASSAAGPATSATTSAGSPTASSPAAAPPAPGPSGTAPASPSASPSPTIREGRFAIGDSVMLGSKPLLRARGFDVDAKVSRQFGAAVNTILRKDAKGGLPRNVIVHLGTNGVVTMHDCRAVVRAAGPDRRVFLVNVRVPRSWEARDNDVLARCAASFTAGHVVLVDWHKLAAGHRSWFGADDVHPDTAGRKAYTDLIASAVDAHGL